MKTDGTDTSEDTIGLVRQTADGLGHLVALHVKLARCEFTRELRSMAGRATLMAALAALLLVGYAMAMAGLAVLIGGNRGVGRPLMMVGIVHVAVASAGLLWCQRSSSAPRPLTATGIEARRTLAVPGDG